MYVVLQHAISFLIIFESWKNLYNLLNEKSAAIYV